MVARAEEMPDTLKKTGSMPSPVAPDATRVWAGRGTGKLCEVCRKAIPAEDVQYDLEMTEDPAVATNASRGRILSFHLHCYDRWRAGEVG
jgi:hypothetical protein